MNDPLLKALWNFSVRISTTDDPVKHQNAGKQLQRDLGRLKIQDTSVEAQGVSRNNKRPTGT